LCLRFFSGDSRASLIESIAEDAAPGIRPDVDSTDASSGDETKESARSGKANEFLRWLNTAKRRPLQQFPG